MEPLFAQPRSFVKPPEPTARLIGSDWADWLDQRGITNPIVVQRNQLHTQQGALKFPYYKNKELINEKSRTKQKDFWLVGDAELIPYGWDDCIGQEVVVIVEGEMDKLAIEQATGWTWVASPPNGSKPSDEVFGKLGELCKQARQIILAGDMDPVGMEFQDLLAERLGFHRCYRVTWPEKDANDTLMKHGELAVLKYLQEARPYPVAGLFTLGDVRDKLRSLYDRGMPRGRTTGWMNVDDFYTVETKQLTTVTGSPGFGKSTWVDHLLVNLAVRHDFKCAICSPEMAPIERHYAKLMQQYVGKPFGIGWPNRMNQEEFEQSSNWVEDKFPQILLDENTIENVLSRAQVAKERYGIKGLVIDPVNTLDAARKNGMTTTEYIHWWLGLVLKFATDYDVHVWLVAHPNKGINQRRDGQGRIPVATGYDIAESAGFYNKSHNIISVWRDPKVQGTTQVHFQKVKFEEIGREGRVDFDYNRSTGRFTECADQSDARGR